MRYYNEPYDSCPIRLLLDKYFKPESREDDVDEDISHVTHICGCRVTYEDCDIPGFRYHSRGVDCKNCIYKDKCCDLNNIAEKENQECDANAPEQKKV